MDIADARLSPGAAAAVTTLYAEHALGLVRLAVVLTGDRGAAEDIVQDAFFGLYRRWDSLASTAAPLAYLRVSVVNGCRSALRRRPRAAPSPARRGRPAPAVLACPGRRRRGGRGGGRRPGHHQG